MNSLRLLKAGSVAACLSVCGGLAAGCSAPAPSAAPAAKVESAADIERPLLAAFASIPGARAVGGVSHIDDQAGESWNLHVPAATAFKDAAALVPHWPLNGPPVHDDKGAGQYYESATTPGTGDLAGESLSIIVTPQGTDSSSLGVTATVAFRKPKPATEHVPDSTVLTVSLSPASAATPASVKVVTAPSTIAQITADINALPVKPGEAMYCPQMSPGPTLTLTFSNAVGAAASDSTIVTFSGKGAGACGPGVLVNINGTKEPALDASWTLGLDTHIEKLAGITPEE